MTRIYEAVTSLRNGNFVLIHDDDNREDEVDLVISSNSITPEHIAIMRKNAGGLICTAISKELSAKLGLPYLYDVLSIFGNANRTIAQINQNSSPYGDKPSFSITINHNNTYTGITDNDRALTISSLANICSELTATTDTNIQKRILEKFQNSFRTPGHVPILIASKGLLNERKGHTEMSIFLTKIANITNITTICEMLDPYNHKALSYKDAVEYAKNNNLVIIEAKELIAYAKSYEK
ncbi:3,4-dihydroxy-2-butanone-4-phosphate synthase [Candidatus Nitrosocosmicus sp. SS]|uniref:3,4-dihydroxy-2-butanone-4-phosphate synthase n=1 Tax=Candidatus Nitrosocosmicus agrestis TaxID=2563600 RepID=UPI00122E5983|nr:3,4-dihydroxy-2-butanone-4-phosphate synthase [Candidatus Nitrosocosmicus sp. SS]KAA2281135.1 3,4-dihydroxy-2-butanone-4-phosphate synthase [Candidatus Nitrosocosmicus sp. SS]KAF0869435.1 3,4-dihydroxy-2-butanone-4-phosphate synthase [Candidatus Nitrosocosmicus sp. SS]MDR4491817.1 3,4-dihydroxy-2-butanone-4-phosphate synthase [Candidatus Nitrosocosmicus sp.]